MINYQNPSCLLVVIPASGEHYPVRYFNADVSKQVRKDLCFHHEMYSLNPIPQKREENSNRNGRKIR